MTFLEYVMQRTLGPPVMRSGNRSYWACVNHDDDRPRLSPKPHIPSYKDRFICFSCGWWGDELDILKECYPGEDYGRRKVRLAGLKLDYENEYRPEDIDSPSFSFRGGTVRDDPRDVASAFDDMMEDIGGWDNLEKVNRQQAVETFVRHSGGNVSGESLLDYWDDTADWLEDSLERHAEECEDELCGNKCRVARGLEPLRGLKRKLAEAIAAEDKRKRKERAQHAMRNVPSVKRKLAQQKKNRRQGK